jgi:DNA transposition AAA+ family ATPase
MTDKELLNQLMSNSGITKSWLARRIGCSRPRIYKILSGGECTASEIAGISEALHLTTEQRDLVFFAHKVV